MSSNRILTNKQIALLKLSSCTKDYPWLVRILNESPKCHWNGVEQYLDGVNIDVRLINGIVSAASAEWKYTGLKDDKEAEPNTFLQCELCGNTRCRRAVFDKESHNWFRIVSRQHMYF